MPHLKAEVYLVDSRKLLRMLEEWGTNSSGFTDVLNQEAEAGLRRGNHKGRGLWARTVSWGHLFCSLGETIGSGSLRAYRWPVIAGCEW